jgi:hypothetical protein
MNHKILTSLILLVFLPGWLPGVASAQKPGEKNIALEFLALPKSLNPEPVELLVNESETLVVHTPGNELSRPYEVPALTSITIGKTVENEDGKPFFEIYGKADALKTSQQIILLIRKGPKNSDGFEVVPINGDLGAFDGGSFLFINVSKTNVKTMIGDSEFDLEPRQRFLISPKPNAGSNLCQVTMSYQDEGRWNKFKDTRWSTNPRYRSLIFFHQDPKTGQLGVAPIIDILPYTGPQDPPPSG